jgi:hypothetical protein
MVRRVEEMKRLVIFEDKENTRYLEGLMFSDQFVVPEKQGHYVVINLKSESHVMPRQKVKDLIVKLQYWLDSTEKKCNTKDVGVIIDDPIKKDEVQLNKCTTLDCPCEYK